MPTSSMLKSKFQIFVENLGLSFLTIIKLFILSNFFLPRIKCIKKSEDCIILGNGPSLTKSMNDYHKFMEKKDLFCVNDFSKTEFYIIIKPCYYVIVAPELWNPKAMDSVKKNYNVLVKSLIEKTTWEIILFVPFIAKKHKDFQKRIKTNKNIKVCYLNLTPVEGFKKINYFLYKKNMGMPRPHNVIIPSLMKAINLRYKNIYLFGVDHSWLPEITVTEKNDVLINQKHFYDENVSRPNTMNKGGVGKRRLHEVLEKFMLSFRGYFIIKDYANYRQSKIFNATKNSYIDAFEKINLDNLPEID